MSYAKRLDEARRHGKLTQSELARRLGLKPQAIQYLETERNNARGSKHTSAIARETGVDAHWLSTGKGTMLPAQRAEQALAEYGELPPEAKEVAIAWSRCAPDAQRMFRELIFIHSMIDRNYPWLRRGRPSGETYDEYEQRMEQNFSALVRLTADRSK